MGLPAMSRKPFVLAHFGGAADGLVTHVCSVIA